MIQNHFRGRAARQTLFGLMKVTGLCLPLFTTLLPLGGCGPSTSSNVQKQGANADTGPSRVRSFSDSRPVTCLAASSGLVWVGTPRGLIRWSMASETPTPTLLTTIDGLPAD